MGFPEVEGMFPLAIQVKPSKCGKHYVAYLIEKGREELDESMEVARLWCAPAHLDPSVMQEWQEFLSKILGVMIKDVCRMQGKDDVDLNKAEKVFIKQHSIN